MDRKEFLSAMLALGGSVVASKASASTLVIEELDRLSAASKSRKIDPSKSIIMSDIHICGEFNDQGLPKHYPNNPVCFEQQIKEILTMRHLPANLIILGDIAWDYGHQLDYEYVAKLFAPIEQAGIKITVAMGNHDCRRTFLKSFPEYAQTTKVAERVVSVVELSDLDFVVLDTLSELPDNKSKVSGEMDKEQLLWLESYLASAKRPIILSAHHPMTEIPDLERIVTKYNNVAAYIYGHVHYWHKGMRIIRPLAPQRMIPYIAIPSTFYGDIGYVVMHSDPKGVNLSYSSNGFWWPQPQDNAPAEWAQRQADLADEKCRILFR